MQPRARFRPPHRLIRLALIALVAVLVVPTAAGVAREAPTKPVVKLVKSANGEIIVANRRGWTLYSLSAERRGMFICTGGCLSIWPPLLVRKRVKPRGPVRLGRVKRPDGRIQVTYRGRPLYRFVEDRRRGETNGEGIKDVGTWHVAKKPTPSAPQPTQPVPYPTTPYPTPTTPPPAESPPPPPPPEYPYPYPYGN
jgi:predicted lipoprotein with Yx(FWY)xxD motif